jgi:hypothetical protein
VEGGEDAGGRGAVVTGFTTGTVVLATAVVGGLVAGVGGGTEIVVTGRLTVVATRGLAVVGALPFAAGTCAGAGPAPTMAAAMRAAAVAPSPARIPRPIHPDTGSSLASR